MCWIAYNLILLGGVINHGNRRPFSILCDTPCPFWISYCISRKFHLAKDTYIFKTVSIIQFKQYFVNIPYIINYQNINTKLVFCIVAGTSTWKAILGVKMRHGHSHDAWHQWVIPWRQTWGALLHNRLPLPRGVGPQRDADQPLLASAWPGLRLRVVHRRLYQLPTLPNVHILPV